MDQAVTGANEISFFVGVTGHRNIVEEDKPEIKRQVIAFLREIKALCGAKEKGGDVPVIMLNGLAQGADMLCAEAAFEVGIDVYAVLPCAEEEYIESFDDEADKRKLHGYLERAKRVILAPDTEQNKEWMRAHGLGDESYEYRQLGIFIAVHSRILIALWDGKPPQTPFGCGTAEVIGFALGHKYFRREQLFSSNDVNECAVLWIKTRRQGDGTPTDFRKTWMTGDSKRSGANGADGDAFPKTAFLREIIDKTVT